MHRWLAFPVLILVALLAWPSPAVHADGGKPVLAYYYPWYESSDWTSGKMSDLPATLYGGGDAATIARHLQQARDNGINGFICTWYGANEPRLTDRCNRLLQGAAGSNFAVTVSPDQAAGVDGSLRTLDGMAAALNYMRDHWMSHPNWLRIDGKPVVVFWNPQSFGSIGNWQALQQRVDPGHAWYWIGEGVDFNYLDVFDTMYFFDISWAAQPAAAMASYGNRLQAYNQAHATNHPFTATVMPGYTDLLVRNGHARDRANGDYYRQAWQAAIDRAARAVIITSWNEWFEGSQIEPSRTYGNLYLDLTRDYAARYQNALPPGVPRRSFPETGQIVAGRLLEYWNGNDGLTQFGLPLTMQSQQTTADGAYGVQWFERNRLELHPENQPPYDVLLGRLGVDLLAKQGRPWETLPKATPRPDCLFFPLTGHNLCEPFLSYWRSHGLDLGDIGMSERESLALYGMPISGVRLERNSSGDTVPTQWFERTRFEYHAGNQPLYQILLGRLGAEAR